LAEGDVMLFRITFYAIAGIGGAAWVVGIAYAYSTWFRFRDPSLPWYKCFGERYFIYDPSWVQPEGESGRQTAIKAFRLFLIMAVLLLVCGSVLIVRTVSRSH
jgi:hypothetical protein